MCFKGKRSQKGAFSRGSNSRDLVDFFPGKREAKFDKFPGNSLPGNSREEPLVMMLQDGSFSKVTAVVDIELHRKVSINTAGGSFFANGVLTTGMCENYNSRDVLNVPAKNILESYASSHEDFNNCVLTANKFSLSTETILDACLTTFS